MSVVDDAPIAVRLFGVTGVKLWHHFFQLCYQLFLQQRHQDFGSNANPVPATETSRLWVKRQPCSCNRDIKTLGQTPTLFLQQRHQDFGSNANPVPATETSRLWVKRQPCSCNRDIKTLGQTPTLFLQQRDQAIKPVYQSLSFVLLQSLPKSITYPAKSTKSIIYPAKSTKVYHLSCKVYQSQSLILQSLPKSYHLFCKIYPSLITYSAKSAQV